MTPTQLDSLAATWIVLGRMFSASPDQESLDAIRTTELLQNWPMDFTAETKRGLDLILQSKTAGETVQEIKDDHFSLVIGPGKMIAAPWESVYRSREGLLFEAETIQVRNFYRKFGLQAPNLNREPDDHISLELEFCATLLTRAIDALEANNKPLADQYQQGHKEFCETHLFTWAPDFFQLVISGAKTFLYQGFGILGADALTQAGQWMELTDTDG